MTLLQTDYSGPPSPYGYDAQEEIQAAYKSLAALDYVAEMETFHLFDALLEGSWGNMTKPKGGKAIMHTLYPCGLIFLGDHMDSQVFDMGIRKSKGV